MEGILYKWTNYWNGKALQGPSVPLEVSVLFVGVVVACDSVDLLLKMANCDG